MVVGGWVGTAVWVGVGVVGRMTADVGAGVSDGNVVVGTAVLVVVALAIGIWLASGSSGAQAVIIRMNSRIINSLS